VPTRRLPKLAAAALTMAQAGAKWVSLRLKPSYIAR